MSNGNDQSFDEKGDESIITGIKESYYWRDAWMRAVAYAWQSDANKLELMANPAKVLQREFNYTITPGISLTVKEYSGSKTYSPKPGVNGWIDLEDDLGGGLVMILPPTPDPKQQAMALADFDALGRTYVHTCV